MLFYASPLVVAATAIACAALALALWPLVFLSSPSSTTRGWELFFPLALPLLYVVDVFPDPHAGAVLLVGGAALALLMAWSRRSPWLLPVASGLVSLWVYLGTLLPSVGEADTLEFQVVAAKLGVAHPTGYPLYVLLGKLFTLLPVKNVAWRVNLASAIFAALAIVVLYDIVRRLTARPLLSLLTALAFAFSATFWSQALIAEVYTLHSLLVSMILWLLVRQLEPHHPRNPGLPTVLSSAPEDGGWEQEEGQSAHPAAQSPVPGATDAGGQSRTGRTAPEDGGWEQEEGQSAHPAAQSPVPGATDAGGQSRTGRTAPEDGGWEQEEGQSAHPAAQSPVPGAMESRDAGSVRGWYAIFFLLGLSLTNHLTTALLMPAALLTILWDRGKLEAKDWLIGVGLFLLGLSLYLFIPLRWPALNDGEWMTLRNFLRYVTGGQFHGALRLDGWRDPTRWRIVGRLLRQPFGWMGLALAAIGVVRLAVDRRRVLALTGVTSLAYWIYGLNYYVADVAVFLLPAHLILAVWIGAGVSFLVYLASSLRHSSLGLPKEGSQSRPSLSASSRGRGSGHPLSGRPVVAIQHSALILLLAMLPLRAIWTNRPAVDRSQDHGSYAWGRYVLDQPLRTGSAILADTKKFAPLYYLQQVEGVRPDLDIVLLGTEELYQRALRRRLGQGQTIYLARYLPHLDDLYLRSVGPVVEVGLAPHAGDPIGPSNASGEPAVRLAPQIELLDAEVEADPLGRALYHVTLRWRATTPVDGDYVVRLRLMDDKGSARWTSHGVRPVNGLHPTNAWPPDVPVSDYHDLHVPAWLPPGRYALQVSLSPSFGDVSASADDGVEWFELQHLEMTSPAPAEPLPKGPRFSYGNSLWLTGLAAAEGAAAGTPLTIDLAWRGVIGEKTIRLSWTDAEGRRVKDFIFPLSAGMVRSRHTLTTPGRTGRYALRLGLVGEAARCRWLAPPSEGCALTEVNVLPGTEGLAIFDDRVLLLDAKVGKGTAVPGEVIPVRLQWRGLRPMNEDYTVFVHLVGPDGRLHGQADSWPVQGSHPTSQWPVGQEIPDPYEVRLDGDAPSGEYRVEVGWYLLETMQRLRVLDEAGEPVADSFVVGTLNVSE
jgi:hypothetical protein